MKVKTNIRDLCKGLEDENYLNIELEQTESFDTERIKSLAFAKLQIEGDTDEKEIITMKRASYRILIAVALIAVLTTTAFAAGGLDFFRSMFGNSIDRANDSIQNVSVSTENENIKMTAEQLISDGYYTKIIVSLTPLSEEGRNILERDHLNEVNIAIDAHVKDNIENPKSMDVISGGMQRMPEFDTKDKEYFCSTYESNSSYADMPIEIKLKTYDRKENMKCEELLMLTIDDPKSITSQKSIEFPVPDDKLNSSYPVSLTVNSISAVLTLQEPKGSFDTPTVDVTIVMKDGSKEKIFEEGWISEGGGQGGGGATFSDDHGALPLATSYSYRRDLDTSQIIQTAGFSQIIEPSTIDYVKVDGKKYEFKN